MAYVMYALSYLTGPIGIWTVLGFLLLIPKKYRCMGATMILSSAIVLFVGDIVLKHLVARLRPFVDFPMIQSYLPLPKATSYSFPSGHSFQSFSAATAIYRGLGNIKPNKQYLGKIAFAVAILVAFARVYLFVHFPTDVLCGAIFGIINGIISWNIVQFIWNYWHGIRRSKVVTYEPYKLKDRK